MYKDLNYFKQLNYNVIIEKQQDIDEFSFIAFSKELGKYSCYGVGSSEAEAIESFYVEKDIFIEYLFNKAAHIPEPESKGENYSGVFNVRTSPIIHEKLVEQAKESGVSLNLYLNQILSAAVEHKQIETVLCSKIDDILYNINQNHLEINSKLHYKDFNIPNKSDSCYFDNALKYNLQS